MEVSTGDLWEEIYPKFITVIDYGLPKRLIADFTGIGVKSINGWVRDTHQPHGPRLIKLWHLIDMAYGDDDDITAMPEYCQIISKLLAYDVLSVDELMTVIHVAHPQSLYTAARGQIPKDPIYDLAQLQTDYGKQIEAAEKALRKKLEKQFPEFGTKFYVESEEVPAEDEIEEDSGGEDADTEEPEVKAEADETEEDNDEDSNGALTETVAHVVNLVTRSADKVSEVDETPPPQRKKSRGREAAYDLAVLLGAARPLAYYMVNHASPADRSELRALMGDDGMFEMSNLLDALCGERALTHQQER